MHLRGGSSRRLLTLMHRGGIVSWKEMKLVLEASTLGENMNDKNGRVAQRELRHTLAKAIPLFAYATSPPTVVSKVLWCASSQESE